MTFLSDLWHKKMPKRKTEIEYGIELVEKLRTVLQHPLEDYLNYLISDTDDSNIIKTIKSKLPCILIDLNLVDRVINKKDSNAVIISAAKCLHSKHGPVQYAFFHSIACIVADIASNGELTWTEIVAIIEDKYQDSKN